VVAVTVGVIVGVTVGVAVGATGSFISLIELYFLLLL